MVGYKRPSSTRVKGLVIFSDKRRVKRKAILRLVLWAVKREGTESIKRLENLV